MQSKEPAAALIFGPTLPAGGVRGSVVIHASGIEASYADQSISAQFAALTMRSIGFGKPGVELAWNDQEGTWAIHVLDSADATRLLENSALKDTPQARALIQAEKRIKVGRAFGWTAIGLFLLSPLLLLALLLMFANPIAGWISQRIPVEQEAQMGKQAFESMQSQLKLRDHGAEYDAVKTIVARLTSDSKYRYEVHISEDPVLNAFAMPGGIVVVNTGLIEATKRPEELAGVLAHEVQHVELRHSLNSLIKNLGLQALWALVTGDLGHTVAGQMALQLTTLKFSRDAESEADANGFDALLAANIDPTGMPDFFATMNQEAGDAPAAFVSTHPLSKDREQILRDKLKQVTQSFPSLDLGAWPPRENH
jgi:Zn-dependent protease with chaperone function